LKDKRLVEYVSLRSVAEEKVYCIDSQCQGKAGVCVWGVRKFSSRVVGGEDWVVYEVLGNRFSLRLGRTRCMKTLSSLVSDVDFQDYTASAC
jgi:predicted metallopeptidase